MTYRNENKKNRDELGVDDIPQPLEAIINVLSECRFAGGTAMAYENGPGFSDGKREVLIKPVYPNYEGYPSGWWRTYSVYKFAVSKHVCEGKVPDTTDDDGVHDYRYSIWACPGSIWDSIWACSGSISNGMAASLEYHHPSNTGEGVKG